VLAVALSRGGLLRDNSIYGELVGGGDGVASVGRAVNAIAGLSDCGSLCLLGSAGRDNDVLGVGGGLANADLLLDVDNSLAGVVSGHHGRRTARALSDVCGVVLGDCSGLSRHHLGSRDSDCATGGT